MKCKICFLSGVIAWSGGTERVGTIIANELCKRGYDVTILSFWNEGTPYFSVDSKVKVDYLMQLKIEGKLYRTVIYPILKLHQYIKKNHIDIIVDIDTVLSRHSGYAVLGTKCKLISWEHFNFWSMQILNEHRRFRAKRILTRYATKLVVLTEEDRMKHIKEYSLNPGFVVTLPNPCLCNSLVEYCFENKKFIAVGRLADEKNFKALLEAWLTVQKKCLDWSLQLIGSGELENDLKKQAHDLKLERVEFISHTNCIEKYYSNASCMILSSKYEGFPMVILEAQTFALPVISFDCKTGPRDLVFDGKNGYLVPNGSIVELANRMIEFTKDKDRAITMSQNALINAKKYSVDNIINKWESLLNDVIKEKHRGGFQ